MSLAQHVAAIEGIDRDQVHGIADEVRVVGRRISYDVLQPPRAAPVAEPAAGIPAYKHSAPVRIVQVFFTVLACWAASGIVFGFAALKPVLIAERVYRDKCTYQEINEQVKLCKQQDMSLNLFFTIASITANMSALPVGTILDRYGARSCGIIGSFLLVIGCNFMAFSFRTPGFNCYIVGNFFLALGGTFVFVPSFQIANAFPRYAGTIVALVTGAFDASAAVFLFYRASYDASGGTVKPEDFFLGYMMVPIVILLANLTFMPKHDYVPTFELKHNMDEAEDESRDVHESDDEIQNDRELLRVRSKRRIHRKHKARQIRQVLGSEEEVQSRAEREQDRQIVSQVWGVLHGLPASKQMATPWFVLITLMTMLQMVRMNYFIATIRTQYEYMLGSVEAAQKINGFFDWALPVGGVLFTPVIGYMLDRLSVPLVLGIIVALTTIIGILNSIPTLWAGYMTVLLFVLLRPLYYSAMSDYATKVFGFATFGRVYGTIICLSGISNFSQYALDYLTHHVLDENPLLINLTMAMTGFCIGGLLVGFVSAQGHKLKAQPERDNGEYNPIPQVDEEAEPEEDVTGST